MKKRNGPTGWGGEKRKHTYQHSCADLPTLLQQQGSYRWAAARTTKSYKHAYGTLAALLRRLETLPSYRHSYVCLRAI